MATLFPKLVKVFLCCIMTAFCDPPGVAAKLLPRANAWLRHRWFAGFVRRSLEEQASHLKGSIDQKVRFGLARPTPNLYHPQVLRDLKLA